MKKNKLKIAVCAAAAVIIFIAAVQLFTPGVIWLFTPKARPQDGVLDSVGASEHITDVKPDEMKYLVNNNVVFETDGKKGNFMFENPEKSSYTLKFFVYEKIGDGKTENKIYESRFIEPGQYLSGDKLRKKLSEGTHECTYIARAYINSEYQGETSGDMTVTVKS